MAVAPVEIQRLDAHPVPGQEELALPGIVHREGEHAMEALEHFRPPGPVSGQQHLGIRVRHEHLVAELGPELTEVVDLAIEDQHVPAIGRAEGLIRCARKVDDAQPAVSERHQVIRPVAGRIRTPVGHGVGHGAHGRRGVLQPLQPQDAGDAAHDRGYRMKRVSASTRCRPSRRGSGSRPSSVRMRVTSGIRRVMSPSSR